MASVGALMETPRRVGRPRKAPSEILVQIPMRLEAGIFEEVCRLAKREAISASEVLRRIIRRAMAGGHFRN